MTPGHDQDKRCACGRRLVAMESRRSGVCGPCLAARRGRIVRGPHPRRRPTA